MKKLALPILVTACACSVFALATGVAGSAEARQEPVRIAPAAVAEAVAAARPVASATVPMSYQEQNMTIGRFCFRCHNDQLLTGGLTLESFDAEHAYDSAEVAEKMIRKLRAGMMPPKEAQQPDEATRMALVTALETTLDDAAAENPNPGRRTFQRLNQAEYAAAVRAMLLLDIDVDTYLPPDTISANFDNIADVQMPSATVMEGYMRAAGHISRVAVGDPAADASSTTYDIPRTQSQKDRVEGAPFGTRGGISVIHNFPADGKYEFQLLFHGEPTGALFGRTIGDIKMDVSVDGERVALVEIDRWISESDPTGLTVTTDPIDVRAGARRVTAAFLKEFEGSEDDLIKPIDHTLADTQIGVGYGVTTLPHLRNMAVVGPFDVTGISDNPTRRKIFSCRPTTPEEELPCAESILRRLATEAYRRPATDADVNELMPFYHQGSALGGFEGGIRNSLQAMLTSLHFLFRMEEVPRDVAAGEVYRISDIDLASRLSFFIWGTVPDQELIDVASAGQLSDAEVFNAQVVRMLEDPRSEALATRFAAQWLRLQDLHKIHPDALEYPYYDNILADSMYRETELLFDHVVRQDLPVTDLLTADYTFVNERLARHYGISGVSGTEFRRADYPDENRRGLLGHGSVLTMTSHGNRTSPVIRGKWVLEVLLGSPPPPPPPNVPDLEESGDAIDGRLLSVAEQLAMHRENPACSSCHNVIDPVGLALDNFDVTGAWRIKDRGVDVDSAGELFDGTQLDGVADLRDAIVRRSDVFITNFTEVLMAYALGRRIEYYDMPAIRDIVNDAAENEYRLSSFVLGVANSAAFQSARAETTVEDNDIQGR